MVGTNGASQSVTLHVGRYGSFDSAGLGKFPKKSGVLLGVRWELISRVLYKIGLSAAGNSEMLRRTRRG